VEKGWQKGVGATGVSGQGCHLPKKGGRHIVNEGKKRTSPKENGDLFRRGAVSKKGKGNDKKKTR